MSELERELTTQVDGLLARIAELEKLVESLQAQLNQNSGNSSRPPSSDSPKAPKHPSKTPTGRKRGAQPGHAGHHRAFAPDIDVSEIIDQRPSICSRCKTTLPADLPDAFPPKRHQVSSLPIAKPIIREYRTHSVICPCCQLTVKADDLAPKSNFDTNTAALSSLLHGRYRLSYREIASFLSEAYGLRVSGGQATVLCRRTSDALDLVHQQTVTKLRNEPAVNVDETTWKQNGQKRWAWVATGKQNTVFLIAMSRRGQTLDELLGINYEGIITTDRFSGYYRIPVERRQICWAHLKRDFQALAERPKEAGRIGKELLEATGEIFAAWERFQRGHSTRINLQNELRPVRDRVRKLLQEGKASTITYEQFRDLLKVEPAFWRFVDVDGIEPTNNAAERAVRPLVIWRKSCYGAFSDWGNDFVERLQSLAATCRQRGQELLPTLIRALESFTIPTQTLPQTA